MGTYQCFNKEIGNDKVTTNKMYNDRYFSDITRLKVIFYVSRPYKVFPCLIRMCIISRAL